MRILVADDNVDTAVTLALVLRCAGHEVTMANDGATALAQANERHPEAVFLDIGLPKMDGYQVARRLRQDLGSEAHALLVAITGYGNDEDRERSRLAGFDHHFVKPVDTDRLIDMLASLERR